MEVGIILNVMDLVHLKSVPMENAKLSMVLQNVSVTMVLESIQAVMHAKN